MHGKQRCSHGTPSTSRSQSNLSATFHSQAELSPARKTSCVHATTYTKWAKLETTHDEIPSQEGRDLPRGVWISDAILLFLLLLFRCAASIRITWRNFHPCDVCSGTARSNQSREACSPSVAPCCLLAAVGVIRCGVISRRDGNSEQISKKWFGRRFSPHAKQFFSLPDKGRRDHPSLWHCTTPPKRGPQSNTNMENAAALASKLGDMKGFKKVSLPFARCRAISCGCLSLPLMCTPRNKYCQLSFPTFFSSLNLRTPTLRASRCFASRYLLEPLRARRLLSILAIVLGNLTPYFLPVLHR